LSSRNDEVRDVLDQRLFTASSVAAIIGVSSHLFSMWVHRGLDLGGVTAGGRRVFSIVDIIAARIVAELAQGLNIGPTIARAAAPFVAQRAGEILRIGDDGLECVQHTVSHQVYLVGRGNPQRELDITCVTGDLLADEGAADDRPAIIVPLDRAISATVRRICEIDALEFDTPGDVG